MNRHEKGMKLCVKVSRVTNSSKDRRVVRRVMRVWAKHWESIGVMDIARAMRNDAKRLY